MDTEDAQEGLEDRERTFLRRCLGNVSLAPPLRQFSGFGFCMLGRLDSPATLPNWWKIYWLSAGFVPVLPICAYLLESPRPGIYHLKARASLKDLHQVYRGRLARFYWSAFEESGAFVIVPVAILVVIFLFQTVIRRALFP